MWPVLQRELREQARQPAGHRLRVLGAAVVLAVLAFGWDPQVFARQGDGRGMFAGLNHVLVTAIWLIAPVLTADCLSREKREGTLGLLFLTPLSAQEVVVGKAFVHALRAFTLILAATPVLMVPVLLGGIGWLDAARMLLLHLAALAMALAAGLLASSVTRRWVRARLLAFVLVLGAAAAFLALNITANSLMMWHAMGGTASRATFGAIWAGHLRDWGHRLGYHGASGNSFWLPVGGAGAWWGNVALAGGILVASLAMVWLAVRCATAGVRRTWQEAPPSPKTAEAVRYLTRVRAPAGWWRRRTARLLDRDPVLWRQTSTWGARLTLFGWLGLTMVLASQAILHDGYADAGAGQWLGRRLLWVGMAFAAAASFREEKGNGGLELLLVTPLSPSALVDGRMRGLARQFGPSAAVLIVLQLVLAIFAYPLQGSGGPSPVAVGMLEGLDLVAWLAASAALGIALVVGRTGFFLALSTTLGARHASTMLGDFVAFLVRPGSAIPFPPGARPEWDATSTIVSLVVAAFVFPVARQIAVRRLAERRFLGR